MPRHSLSERHALSSFVDLLVEAKFIGSLSVHQSARGESRKALADQLTTASRKRLVGYLGKLSAADMAQVDRAIRLQLALS